MAMLTIERLKELLSYDPETGAFTWRINRGNNGGGATLAGDRAGTVNKEGRRTITVDGKRYLASRLAFLYMTGSWPKRLVDHRDLNKGNDAWENLRDATYSQNNANKISRNPLGKGVKRSRGKFRAEIRIAGRKVNLGTRNTAEEAAALYAKAANDHFGEFARSA